MWKYCIESHNSGPEEDSEKYFTEACDTVDDIVDDHTPFKEQGLRRTLHVISDPFPATWHTTEDNRQVFVWELLSAKNVRKCADSTDNTEHPQDPDSGYHCFINNENTQISKLNMIK